VIAALMEKEDRIVADRLSHASLLEAASLSPAAAPLCPQRSATSGALLKPPSGQQLVVTEGVFSMDGDSAPLAASRGGETAGRVAAGGRCARYWRKRRRRARQLSAAGETGAAVVTFGKGFGVSGAAVLCSEARPTICCSLPAI
jgi:8-amino-7-oxononanoate synthase